MIAWSRLLGGGVRDASVGGHLLIGVAFGVGFATWGFVESPPSRAIRIPLDGEFEFRFNANPSNRESRSQDYRGSAGVPLLLRPYCVAHTVNRNFQLIPDEPR